MLIIMIEQSRVQQEYLTQDLIHLVGEEGWIGEGFLEVVTGQLLKEAPK